MEEHKVLTGMLLVALVVSVVGTVVTVDRLGSVGLTSITGAATGEQHGEGNITIESVLDIALQPGEEAIDFGSGSVNSGEAWAYIESNGSGTNNAYRGNWSVDAAAETIEVSNIGNVAANITIASDRSWRHRPTSPDAKIDSSLSDFSGPAERHWSGIPASRHRYACTTLQRANHA